MRAFLEQLAAELDAAGRREQELREQLAAAEEQARHPVLDEGALTAALGQRSAAVLRNAHEEAARIAQHAEETAATALRDAQAHATEVQVTAESQAAERIAEAELEANALRQQAKDEAVAVLEAARNEGESLVERAREHGRAMLDQAQEARRRVLADMAHRRRAMTEQIEQFRAARDEIASSVVGVRHSLDRIVDDLGRAEDAARAAATQAAQAHPAPATEHELVEEAERAAEELGLPTGRPEESVAAASAARTAEGATSLRLDDIATVVSEPRPAGTHAPPETLEDVAPLPVLDPADTVGASEVRGDSDAASEVEELFARLRARHGDAPGLSEEAGAADTEPVGAQGAPGDPGDAAAAALGGDADAAGAPTPNATAPNEAAADDPAADGSAGAALASEPDDATVPDAEPEDSGPDAAALAARDEALEPVVTAMARRLKRALQDDQNRLLDRLRQGTGDWSDDLLADEAAQRALYSKAAAGGVRDSIAAGTDFARSLIGGRHPKTAAPDQRSVDAITDDLAATIVALLRRRLEGAEIPDAAERIGAAYREWRGERIERLTEDRAVEAFDAGVLAGAARAKGLRWVRSQAGPGCADCEDNALAGDVVPGEEFPTGHRYPPAHPGCRCLVVPTAT